MSSEVSRGSSNSSTSTGIGLSPRASGDGIREVKTVLVGEAGVGKSSLTLRFVNNQFKDHVPATVGASCLSKVISVKGHVKFNIWDTAGQEKYRSLASLYYRGVDCAVIVYDITNRCSFDEVQNYWMQELKHQCHGNGGLQICIAGNKCDLHDRRQVSEEEGKRLAEENGVSFFECSAKTDENITEIFIQLAMDLPESERTVSTASRENVYQVHIPPRKSLCC